MNIESNANSDILILGSWVKLQNEKLAKAKARMADAVGSSDHVSSFAIDALIEGQASAAVAKRISFILNNSDIDRENRPSVVAKEALWSVTHYRSTRSTSTVDEEMGRVGHEVWLDLYRLVAGLQVGQG